MDEPSVEVVMKVFDGIIKEDRLGLDIIYIQAKRWENIVTRPEIQKFAGALQVNVLAGFYHHLGFLSKFPRVRICHRKQDYSD